MSAEEGERLARVFGVCVCRGSHRGVVVRMECVVCCCVLCVCVVAVVVVVVVWSVECQCRLVVRT